MRALAAVFRAAVFRAAVFRAGCAGLALLASACGGGPDAPRIDDSRFAQRAEQICVEQLPPLRADLADDEPRQAEEVAPTVAARADSLQELVRSLAALEVRPQSEAAVGSWLADWQTYVDVGRRYAKALKTGDPDRYAAVSEEGLGPQARISAFARTNGFKSCALDGVPLPPREGL